MPDSEPTGTLERVVPGIGIIRRYERSFLRPDVFGGITVWAMLVPQSLGFAVLAGVPPVVGLYAAFGSMLLYWLWGSSRHLSLGAESTIAIMVATILADRARTGSDEYVAFAATLALLVGLILLAGGLFRLGRVADFLSRPVLAGYVFGSGVLIVTSQVQGFLGTSIDPEPYLTEVGGVVRNLDDAAWASVLFGVATLAVVISMKRFLPTIPGALVAVVGSMLVVAVFDVDVAVVGEFASGLPSPGLPDIGWSEVVSLIGPAFAVALLVYPDSVLTARSLAYGTPDRIDANREFLGVAAANFGSGLMGAFPSNGSQSRSFVLADTGARTQMANVVAAILVVLTLLFLAPVFDFLPTATLAAIVMVAGFGLLDLAEFRSLWRYRRSEFWMAIITIAGVLGLGMLVGILIAIGLSLLLVVLKAASPHTAVLGRLPETDTYRDIDDHPDAITFPGVLIYRFDASLFFANAPRLRDEILELVDDGEVRTVIIDMESVDDIDSTGAQVLTELLDELGRRGAGLELARVRTEIRDELDIAEIESRLAGGTVYLQVNDAVTAVLDRSGEQPEGPD